MSRAQPYRGKMPVHILQLLDVATRITLFMVGQNGPLSFVFKDRLDNKYKTSIGATLKCSCSPNRNDHCIHTIYILLRIFKMSVQNPLIWQAAYVDSQLSDLLSGKHTVAETRRIIRPIFQPNDDFDLPSKFLYQKRIEIDYKVERMKLQEDSVCPICQQSMSEDMCLSYCRVKCGNNFHLECIKIWAQHKSTTQAAITCPMCRTSLGKDYLKQIIQEEQDYNKRQQKTILHKCSGCGVNPIPSNPHKCLLCTNYQLCQCCYEANKHIKHPFIRKNNQNKWHGAQQRRQSQLKIKNYIQNRRKQTVNDKLLEKLRKVQEDPSKLLDFIASSYPYVSKYISDNIDPNKKLGFSAEDMKCMKCHSKKMIFLRRLNCGHFIDHQCLKEHIRKQKFHCDQDGTKILKGYQDLIRKQKQIQIPLTSYQVKKQFDPSHLENNQYNFVNQETNLLNMLGGHQEQDTSNYQRIRQRFVSNMVSRQEPIKRQSSIKQQQPNQIRVRQVSRSTTKRDKSQQFVPRNRKSNHQQMQRMITAMIGKKVF